jgi:hypothetical protein
MDAERKKRYLSQLNKCGFRSWKKANKRRCNLIEVYIRTSVMTDELRSLQKLFQLRADWKSGGDISRVLNALETIAKRLEKRS